MTSPPSRPPEALIHEISDEEEDIQTMEAPLKESVGEDDAKGGKCLDLLKSQSAKPKE